MIRDLMMRDLMIQDSLLKGICTDWNSTKGREKVETSSH